MPKANQLKGDGGIYHVTHRRHDRKFLLKSRQDRDAYRDKLREHLKQGDVALLDHCITFNHVHLLIDAEDRLEVGRFMRAAAGEFARLQPAHSKQ